MGSWPEIYDATGGGLNGTATNMEEADVVSGVSRDIACSFNGSDELVTMGNVLAFEYTSSFSLSCWFKTSSTSAQAPVGKMGGATTYTGYALVVMSGEQLVFYLISDWGTTNAIEVRTYGITLTDAWHHVVVTWTGSVTPTASGVKIYIDGVLQPLTVEKDSLSGSIVSTDAFMVGSRPGTQYFNGFIDDVAVYNKTLSQAEVTNIFNAGLPDDLSSDANLVGYWRMGDGATSPTIPDDSTNSNDGTMTNMDASNFVDGVTSRFSLLAMLFDGVDEYVTMGDVLGFEYDEAFSVSAWFKMTGSGDDVVVSKQDGSTTYRGWGLFLNSGQINWQLNNDVGSSLRTQIKTTATFNDGAWHHVVATYTASTPGAAADMDLYVDGVNVATSVVSDTLGSNTILNTSSLNLGARTDGTDGHFAGEIDEVAVYDKAISLVEAQWIYNAKDPRDLLNVAAPSNLVAWWRMGDLVGDHPQAVIPVAAIGPNPVVHDGHGQELIGVIHPQPPVQYYRMRGVDTTCPAIQQPAYVYWTVQGEPDFLAAQLSAAALPCGSDPLTDVAYIQVAAEWQVVYE